MPSILINTLNDSNETEYPIAHCHGYKKLSIPEQIGLETVTLAEAPSDKETLAITKNDEVLAVEDAMNSAQKYIICDEIGIVPIATMKYTSEFSVIFLKGGKMLIHLLDGVVAVRVKDTIVAVGVGQYSSVPVNIATVQFKSTQDIEGLFNYPSKDKFNLTVVYPFEFEHFVQMGAYNDGFHVHFYKDRDIDISRGYIGGILKKMTEEEDAKTAEKLFHNAEVNAETSVDNADDEDDGAGLMGDSDGDGDIDWLSDDEE